MKILLEHIFIRKNFRKKLAENLLGSGSGSGRFRKLDPDPDPVKIVRICNTGEGKRKRRKNLLVSLSYIGYILYVKDRQQGQHMTGQIDWS
jgi:hypothetical protein